MKKIEIQLDEETDEILSSLSKDYAGDRDLAIGEAVRMHGVMSSLLDELEERSADSLRKQKERSEQGFLAGKYTTWEEVKRTTRR